MNHIAPALLSCLVVAGAAHTAAGEEEPKAAWNASVALGITLADGNSKALTANGAVSATRECDIDALTLDAAGSYGEAEVASDAGDGAASETTVDNAKLSANYKYKIRRSYAYGDTSVFRDKIAGIDCRLVAGGGLGRYLLRTETARLNAELGAAYVREDQAAGRKAENVSARAAARHDQTFGAHARLWGAAEWLPNTEDLGDYLLNAEAGAEAALNTRLSLRLVVQDRYDSAPPPESEHNDVAVVGSLVYRLRP